jgi:hypothetical protein
VVVDALARIAVTWLLMMMQLSWMLQRSEVVLSIYRARHHDTVVQVLGSLAN